MSDWSELRIVFDPSYQELRFHDVHLVREGKVLPRLKRDAIKLLQREEDLERQLYDGRLTAWLNLDDVRVGDVLEYSHTIRGINPIFGNRYSGYFDLQWYVPVRKQFLRVSWAEGRNPHFKVLGSGPSPGIKRTANGNSEAIWEQSDLPAVVPDSDLPGWFDPCAQAQISEFADWADVGRWGLALYEPIPELTATLQSKCAQWRQQSGNQADQFLAALRFVQDDVRYLGIEMGENSHRPTTPSAVAERRFGDCKDKTWLLCALLRERGIPAVPALVHTAHRHTVENWLPSPAAFNHVIVRAELDGQTLWVDPPRTQQRGGLGDLYLPDYARALPIVSNVTALAQIAGRGAPRTVVCERFTLGKDDEPTTLRVETEYRGLAAEQERVRLADTRREEIEKQCINYYARRFPQITSATPPGIHDDPVSNLVRIVEQYCIREPWTRDTQRQERSLEFLTLAEAQIDRPRTLLRTMPLAVNHPVHIEHTVEVHLSEKWQVRTESKQFANEALRFRYDVSCENRTFRLRHEYQTLRSWVPVEQLHAHLQLFKELRSCFGYQISGSLNPRLDDEDEEDPTPVPASPGTNWSMLCVALGSMVAFIYLAVRLYRWRPDWAAYIAADNRANPKPIGGWLILLACGVAASPFFNLYQFVERLEQYTQRSWHMLTVPGDSLYHPLWEPLLVFNLVTGLFLSSESEKAFREFRNAFRFERNCSGYGLVAVTRAAVTTASAATTAPAATAAAEVATRAFFTGTGFVDGQRAPAEFLAIELRNRSVGFLLGAHFDERETAGFVGELVDDQFAPHDGPGLLEQVEHFAFGCVE